LIVTPQITAGALCVFSKKLVVGQVENLPYTPFPEYAWRNCFNGAQGLITVRRLDTQESKAK
jgi:hypothetical protein